MKITKKQKIGIAALAIVVVLIVGVVAFVSLRKQDEGELRAISSYDQLMEIYNGTYNNDDGPSSFLLELFTLPFSMINRSPRPYYSGHSGGGYKSVVSVEPMYESGVSNSATGLDSTESSSSSSSNYSTTNIQVENVDEADITKTDGDYIYSLSDNNVVITNVQDPKNLKIETKIAMPEGVFPEDVLINGDKLVVISSDVDTSSHVYRSSYSNRYNNSQDDTVVTIYDISSKAEPRQIESYTLYGDYYTSRSIDNLLYVIATGGLRKESGKIATYYTENGQKKEIGLDNIKYLEDVVTSDQTLISTIDLSKADNQVKVDSYLMDVSNAYVSENAIYLLEQKYSSSSDGYGMPKIRDLFGPTGVFGVFDVDSWYDDDYTIENRYETDIYKFEIGKDGSVSYTAKAKTDGKTINQYSIDEHNGHLRVALQDVLGSWIEIFDENLNEIGKSDYVAEGETMYSTRFIGDKAYLVTFKNIDPLFVFDLSDETEPAVLGELKIPGYSMYLHPYDETHLIGIGMDTKTRYSQDLSGEVVAGGTSITGMKMALFDISDVNNPKEISKISIGDSHTTSAILENPKALLFSKEKNLLAIPVNNYYDEFEIEPYDEEDDEEIMELYRDFDGEMVGEGYFVYSVDPENGFKLRGVVTHEGDFDSEIESRTNLMRGLYIDDDLFTISQNMIKANRLSDLGQISELKIRETKNERRKY